MNNEWKEQVNWNGGAFILFCSEWCIRVDGTSQVERNRTLEHVRKILEKNGNDENLNASIIISSFFSKFPLKNCFVPTRLINKSFNCFLQLPACNSSTLSAGSRLLLNTSGFTIWSMEEMLNSKVHFSFQTFNPLFLGFSGSILLAMMAN